jgi:hypothetical protein
MKKYLALLLLLFMLPVKAQVYPFFPPPGLTYDPVTGTISFPNTCASTQVIFAGTTFLTCSASLTWTDPTQLALGSGTTAAAITITTNAHTAAGAGQALVIQSDTSNAVAGTAQGGALTVQAANGAGTQNSNGGTLTIKSGSGSIASVGAGTTAGGPVFETSGSGGNSTTSANGGQITLTSGSGGPFANAASGGAIVYSTGSAGASSNNSGGNFTFNGGAGNGGGSGARLTFNSGFGGATGNGGNITFSAGGAGATSGNGGGITFTGGNSLTSGNGGAVSVTAGTGAGGGTNGTATMATPFSAVVLSDAGVNTGVATFTNTAVALPVTIVASLPACGALQAGELYAVSDALGPAYNAIVVGGGAVTIPVFCNGTNWTAH